MLTLSPLTLVIGSFHSHEVTHNVHPTPRLPERGENLEQRTINIGDTDALQKGDDEGWIGTRELIQKCYPV